MNSSSQTQQNKIEIIKAAHSRDSQTVLKHYNSSPEGISEQEAKRRLELYGANRLPAKKELHPVLKFLSQFNNVLIYVLLVSAVISVLLNHLIDAWIILAVVVINGTIGYIQEGKAEKALEAVKNMLSLSARVRRGGERSEIDAESLVPGDIVLIKSGDKIPADLRLLDVNGLSVNEASLTGESENVFKTPEPVKEDAPLGDRFSMVYSGTLVSSGTGTGVVVATGSDTELGKINTMLSEVKSLSTPLIRQITQFGRGLTIVILLISIATFLIGYFGLGWQLGDMFRAVVGLAVAAIPEGLPAIITIVLAIGVQRMARRNAIIRVLPGVETLGSVSVICTDKTGTLTKGEMTAVSVLTRDKSVDVSGAGYESEGEFSVDGSRISPLEEKIIGELIQACVLCNDSRLDETDEGHKIIGTPTEGALLVMGAKSGLSLGDIGKSYPRLDSVPFESEHKYMATLNEWKDGSRVVFLKGAPEAVLSRCEKQITENAPESLDRSWWESSIQQYASKGLRLLAVAYKDFDRGSLGSDTLQGGFTLLGLVGIIDPPREEAINAVRECKDAGIRVKMITGDHALTARAIGNQVGLGDDVKVMTGNDLDKVEEKDMPEIAETVDVFARVSPEHKLKLVKALQKKGNVTAMTGDGVNDAPALKRADIGVAMGIKGTEASKEAAVMVLADDNFASITNAVEEGRTVYDNLRKSLLFILPTNGGQALVIITAIILNMVELPITAAQILWVNMVTAVTLTLALAFEPMEKDVMKRTPRDPKEPLLTKGMFLRVSYVSVLLNVFTLLIFWLFTDWKFELEYARTMAVNTIIAGEVFYLFNSRFITSSSFNFRGIKATKYVWGTVGLIVLFQILFTYVPIFNRIFGTSPLQVHHWLYLISAGFALFVFVEVEKRFTRLFAKKYSDQYWTEKRGRSNAGTA
ncbi:MAG: cation-translocating P-type ATPase [Chitinispirillaceae bacterium]